ncbi:MAG: hypothetical protein HFI69_03835 [Lachnospiraceae bacterium]|nr:hypothetical protein [Lachnospiraceae bacterium]
MRETISDPWNRDCFAGSVLAGPVPNGTGFFIHSGVQKNYVGRLTDARCRQEKMNLLCAIFY